MRLFDISPRLEPGIGVWPGDRPFSRSHNLRMAAGAPINLGSIELSLHTGAHADAPLHFNDSGASIDEVELQRYLGPARLVSVQSTESVKEADLRHILEQRPERLLVRCNPDFSGREFPSHFVYFTSEAARAIGEAGVCLVGLDAPSVDHVDSRSLDCHHIFERSGVAILENLVFDGVPDGAYELIALPLRIVGGDASPVRAVLRTP